MASSLAETIKADFLNCAVCIETYHDPRALPCQHGFCRDCLEQLVASSKDKKTLVCPTCREEVKLSRDEVKNLPVHFLVSSLKDTVDIEQKDGENKEEGEDGERLPYRRRYRRYRRPRRPRKEDRDENRENQEQEDEEGEKQTRCRYYRQRRRRRTCKDMDKEGEDSVEAGTPDATCTNCSTPGNKAKVRCVDCQDFLCDVCLNHHKSLKATKDHKVITMEDIAAGKVDFKKEEENRYCKAHGMLCEYYCETEEKVLCRDCVILNSCPAQHTRISLKEAAENLADELKKLKSKCVDALEKCQEAVAMTKGVSAELLVNHQAAKDSLSKVETQYIDRIRKQVKELQGNIDQMKEEREEKINQQQQSLEQSVRDFEKTSEDVSRVLESESEFEILSAHSNLSSQLECLLECQTEPADKSLGCIKLEAATLLLPPIGEVIPREEWKEIGQFSTGDIEHLHGIDVNEEDNVVVCSWDKGVRVFSAEGKLKCTLYDSPGSVDVAVTQDQTYVSAPHTTCNISTHDFTGQEISSTPVTNMDSKSSYVNSIAVDPSGRIIVAQLSNTISIHNADGSVVSKFATKSKPYRLSATSNRAIVASINRGESLQLMDYSGGSIKIVGPPPEVKTWQPGFVCCSQSEIFVCNEVTGIYMFTSEGDYLGCVTTNVASPRGITLSKCESKLYVAEDHCVKTFQRP